MSKTKIVESSTSYIIFGLNKHDEYEIIEMIDPKGKMIIYHQDYDAVFKYYLQLIEANSNDSKTGWNAIILVKRVTKQEVLKMQMINAPEQLQIFD